MAGVNDQFKLNEKTWDQASQQLGALVKHWAGRIVTLSDKQEQATGIVALWRKCSLSGTSRALRTANKEFGKAKENWQLFTTHIKKHETRSLPNSILPKEFEFKDMWFADALRTAKEQNLPEAEK